jgi:hypothetical protein
VAAQVSAPKAASAPAPKAPSTEGWIDPDADSTEYPFKHLEPGSGRLSDTIDVPFLLWSAWCQRVTGRVYLTHGNDRAAVTLARGRPIHVEVSQGFASIEEYLWREGKITRPQYQKLRVQKLRGPRQVGAYLVSQGFLKPSELFAAVRGHVADSLYGLFEWEKGDFYYAEERVDTGDQVALDLEVGAIVVEGVRRKYLMDRLAGRVGGPSSLLQAKPTALVEMDPMGLDRHERQVVRLLDGGHSMEDIVFTSALPALRVYQIAVALLIMGYAEVLIRGETAEERERVAAYVQIDRERVQDKLDQVRKFDYFQVLGVSRRATPYEIERAYERLIRDFAPESLPEALRSELGRDLAEIRAVLADARDVLRDDLLRNAYARHL